MKKVLLVDDEIYILERIKRIINWEEHGFTIVDVVTSGEKAIDYLSENEVDIIISDINMPVMSGFELFDNLNALQKTMIYKIILTGYADFEYAKQAICYGVRDYLLKPVNVNELITCLKKANNEIDKMTKRSIQLSEMHAVKKQLEKNRNNELILKYLKWNITLDELRAYTKIPVTLESETRKICCIISLSLDEKWKNQSNLYRDRVIGILVESFNNRSINFVILKDHKDIIGLFEMGDSIVELLKNLTVCFEELSENNGINAVGYMGNKVNSLVQLPKAYGTAKYVMENHTLTSTKKIITFDDLTYHDSMKETVRKHLLKLKVYFNSKDIQNVNNEIQEIFTVNGDYEIAYNDLIWMIDAFNSSIKEIAFEHEIDLGSLLEEYYSKEKLLSNTLDLDELIEYFYKMFDSINRLRKEQSERARHSEFISKVIDYIENNYSNVDLSVKEIAEKHFISYNYLSSLFKQETGIAINNYIASHRISVAKELLIENKYLINDISQRTGFKDVKYFSKCFKKLVGIPPSEYINNH